MAALRDSLGSVIETEADQEQIEIGFVPASERRRTTPAIADTIITVGQRSQQKKKRKRNAVSNGLEDDVETFDHTAEPSILDGGEVKEVRPVKKKRNKGKRIWTCELRQGILTTSREPAPMEYGNFPAPPKAHNQPRSGNQSYSFR